MPHFNPSFRQKNYWTLPSEIPESSTRAVALFCSFIHEVLFSIYNYGGKNSTIVSRFQCFFLDPQLFDTRKSVASGHQELSTIPMDRQLPDGDWSTSG
jgi:hypothetical protein